MIDHMRELILLKFFLNFIFICVIINQEESTYNSVSSDFILCESSCRIQIEKQ